VYLSGQSGQRRVDNEIQRLILRFEKSTRRDVVNKKTYVSRKRCGSFVAWIQHTSSDAERFADRVDRNVHALQGIADARDYRQGKYPGRNEHQSPAPQTCWHIPCAVRRRSPPCFAGGVRHNDEEKK
jgi:hypothetical protein